MTGTVIKSAGNAEVSYADRLAARVKKVLYKQVRDNGYEVDAMLAKKVGGDSLGIADGDGGSKTLFSVPVKIIITSHDIEQFSMELGDNPDDILDFIWIPPSDFGSAAEYASDVGADCREVDEGLTVGIWKRSGADADAFGGVLAEGENSERYHENVYVVTMASPTSLGGNLIIKECRAKRLR